MDALEKYYVQGGTLDTLLIGSLAPAMSAPWQRQALRPDRPYWRDIAGMINDTSYTRERLHPLGEVSDQQYVNLITGARFVWHNVLYDHGSLTALDAARAGVPLLSSDYPEMRYICETFNIPCSFFPPTEVDGAADALLQMERGVQDGKPTISYRKPDRWQETLDNAFDDLLAQIWLNPARDR